MASVTLRAFAKINLSLRIKETRPDGYHEVQTILQGVDVFDRVTCEARRGAFAIRCSAAGVPTDRRNLVWKAAQGLWAAAGRRGKARDAVVTLEKSIPIEAGLGGGSSDAAAALVGLRRVWGLRVGDKELQALAATLGSDVPYFLIGGTALGLGRGDEVYPLADLPRLWVVLVFPSFGIATRDAYAWLDRQRRRKAKRDTPPLSALPSWLLAVPLVNDLEVPVIERHPEIGQLKERLRREGASIAAMSGSGSTVFGVFTSGTVARSAARKLRKLGLTVRCARFRGRGTR